MAPALILERARDLLCESPFTILESRGPRKAVGVDIHCVPTLRRSVQEVLDKASYGDEAINYKIEFETKSGEIWYLLGDATTRRDPENVVVGGRLCCRAGFP